MNVHYPDFHYDKNYRSETFPLLRAFLKGKEFTDLQRIAMYGVSNKDFNIVNEIHQAEVCVLPMSWNYYVKTKQLKLAQDYIENCKNADKQVWSFVSGDHSVKHPDYDHVFVFRLGGYKSKKNLNHKGMPVFIGDYLCKNELSENYLPQKYKIKPLVGFCGQANPSRLQAGFDIIKKSWFNIKSKTGLSFYEPEALLATSYLRAKLLQQLSKSEAVSDQFILRKRYRAGVSKGKDTHQTTLEFYNNLLESHYVLCVRGGGNFSVRFFETLMMGRIPIYIHTDGFLPLSDQIDWKQHVVWIDSSEQDKIVEKVVSFHSQLNPERLKSLSESNRKLWEEKLTMKGFFKTVSKSI
ncbi:exostosin domain-containing protein [Aestuariibaculum suncheonense]|uniref:Exostosin family protein n=1 Tax=Aestuariibaculum suncheonense TaxID=1028745 RepID=A0A8J6QNJ3_9FLAO|nr:exostosin family protein [Aestuariibaculum suncheonense]MBD0836997.1 exostosin family protein [Aestuariibaculum suncheonense]